MTIFSTELESSVTSVLESSKKKKENIPLVECYWKTPMSTDEMLEYLQKYLVDSLSTVEMDNFGHAEWFFEHV